MSITIASGRRVRYERWGRNVSPKWVHGTEVNAPTANTMLVSKIISSGKKGYIYGFFISASEANDFLIQWTYNGSLYQRRIPFSGKGAVQVVSPIALNDNHPADSLTAIIISVVNAGTTGSTYQAAILYDEE